MLNEGNKRDEYLEKKGESTKTTAMRKSSERRGRFSAGDTHQSTERENITWARPGTRPHADSLDRQRKGAHRMSRGRTKPQAGSSPEDRKWDAFVGDEKKGKYQKLQDKKQKGQPTDIEAQKQGIIRKGEKRRQLRAQAVEAIRRAVGGGYVNEAKVDDRLSADQKETIRNLRLSRNQRLPVRGETPRDTEERLTQTRRKNTARDRGAQGVRGTQLPKYKKHSEYGGITFQNDFYPERVSARRSDLRAKTAKNNIRSFKEGKTFEEFMIEARKLAHSFPLSKDELATVQRIRDHLDGKSTPESSEEEKSPARSASRRKPRRIDFEVREENNLTEMPYQNFVRKVDEEFKDLTPEKEERVRNRVGELARDIQVSGARMKELNKKPFGKYRPKVKAEKESILKSARKKHKHVTNASDALVRTSISREARMVKKMHDLKKRIDDELNQ